jgi:hypothetical protein
VLLAFEVNDFWLLMLSHPSKIFLDSSMFWITYGFLNKARATRSDMLDSPNPDDDDALLICFLSPAELHFDDCEQLDGAYTPRFFTGAILIPPFGEESSEPRSFLFPPFVI